MLHVVSSDYPLPTINVQSYGEDGLYDTCAKLVTCVVVCGMDDIGKVFVYRICNTFKRVFEYSIYTSLYYQGTYRIDDIGMPNI